MTETVITERVRFDNGTGDVLVGDLCRPGGLRSEVPALVVTGSWTTVKEQMAGLYARRLAAGGFIALAFDFTGYGQIAGVRRDVEEPTLKASDFNAAVSFLQNADGV